MIFTVRATSGRERQAIDKLVAMMDRGGYGINSILYPHRIKGYFFVEGDSEDEVRRFIYGVPNVKGIVVGNLSAEDVNHFLSPAEVEIEIEKGYIVEIVSGPFKGEKAKVQRVSKQKEEIVVELLEAAVPIPLTLKLDSIRVIKKD